LDLTGGTVCSAFSIFFNSRSGDAHRQVIPKQSKIVIFLNIQNFIKTTYSIKKGEQARENTQEYKFLF
jgi:gas vesicle protein